MYRSLFPESVLVLALSFVLDLVLALVPVLVLALVLGPTCPWLSPTQVATA